MKIWNEILGNQVLVSSVIGWIVAQFLKTVIDLVLNRSFNPERIFGSGGMPSSHSAFVCACAASTGNLYGFSSALFAIAAVVAIVVMYDAANVRKAAGEQAKILNYMMNHWSEMKPALFSKELKELLSHSPLQVIMGALLGIAIGLLGTIFFK